MSDNVLGLDLGLDMGWAVGTKDMDLCESGMHKLRNEKEGQKESSIYTFLEKTLEQFDFKQLAYEKVTFVAKGNGIYTLYAFGSYMGIIEYFCYQKSIRTYAYTVQDIKKHMGASGKGKAGMMSAIALLGMKASNHNQADAIATWHLHCTTQKSNRLYNTMPIAGKIKRKSVYKYKKRR